jgi:hypothetical protein
MTDGIRGTYSPEQTTRAVSDAITSALCVVTARASTPQLDTDGWDLYVATQHARALGASHAQVVTAMRGEG